MFFKGYSLTVEQWSSKSFAWVQFLLSLILKFIFKFLTPLVPSQIKKKSLFNLKKQNVFSNKKLPVFFLFLKNSQSNLSFKLTDLDFFFVWINQKFLINPYVQQSMFTFLTPFCVNRKLIYVIKHLFSFELITVKLLFKFNSNINYFLSNYFKFLNKYVLFKFNNSNYSMINLCDKGFTDNLIATPHSNFKLFPSKSHTFFFKKLNQMRMLSFLINSRSKKIKKLRKLKFNVYLSSKIFLSKYNQKTPSTLLVYSFAEIFKLKIFIKKNLKYAALSNLFFKKFPRLFNKFKSIRFNKFKIPLNDLINYDNITISKTHINFNKFEFSLLKSFKSFFLSKMAPVANNLLNLNFLQSHNYDSYISKDVTLDTDKFPSSSIPPVELYKKKQFLFFGEFHIKNIFSLFTHTLIFKHFFFQFSSRKNFYLNFILTKLNSYVKQHFFYSPYNNFFRSNMNKSFSFSYVLTKKIIKVFNYKKFDFTLTTWHNDALIRFFEHCSGKKVLLKFFFFLNNSLNFYEYTRCSLWAQKLQNFQKTIGHGFFLFESIQIIYISIKLKDPYFLINWMRQTFQKISFWKYRMFFHYLKYLFKYFVWSVFSELQIKGLKFKLKGKVSVSGNSRTRTVVYQIGHVSHSTYDNKILHSFDLIKTFTGVIGLQIWMVF